MRFYYNKSYYFNNYKPMLKYIVSIFILMVTFSSVSAGESVNTSPEFGAVQLYDFDFEAELENGKVYMEWDEFDGDDFKWYKIVRSQKNISPAYPEDGGIRYFDSSDVVKAHDYAPRGVSYYRLCAITHENERFCSRVVTIENNSDTAKKEYYKKTQDKKTYIKKVHKENRVHVTSKLKTRLQNFVKNYATRLENSDLSDDEKFEKIETMIERLDVIAEKKPRLETIIDYLVQKLRDLQSEYQDDLGEIESLFEEIIE